MSGGYVGFDRDALTMLRVAVRDALDDCGSWALGDIAAAEARRELRAAVSALDGWDTRLRRIIDCAALTELFSWRAGAPAGWNIRPSAGPGAPSAPEQRLYGELVAAQLLGSDRSPAALSDDELLAALDRVLGSPDAAAGLLEALGADAFVELLDRYATAAGDEPAGGDPRAAQAMSMLASLGAVFGRALECAQFDRGRWLDRLGDADPLGAASVIAAAAGALGDAELRSMLDGLWPPGRSEGWTQREYLTVNALLAAASADQSTAYGLLDELSDGALGDLLLWVDPDAVGTLLLAALPPSLDATTAAALVPRIIESITAAGVFPIWAIDDHAKELEGTTATLPTGLATVLAPWIRCLLTPTTADGKWDVLAEGETSLSEFVILLTSDPAAMRTLSEQVAADYRAAIDTGDLERICAAAYAFGAIGGIERRWRTGDELAANDRTELGVTAAEALIGTAVSTPVGLAVSLAAGALIEAYAPDEQEVHAGASADEERAAVAATSIALSSFAVAAGVPPPVAPGGDDRGRDRDRPDAGTRRFNAAIDEWIDTLPADLRHEARTLWFGVGTSLREGDHWAQG